MQDINAAAKSIFLDLTDVNKYKIKKNIFKRYEHIYCLRNTILTLASWTPVSARTLTSVSNVDSVNGPRYTNTSHAWACRTKIRAAHCKVVKMLLL